MTFMWLLLLRSVIVLVFGILVSILFVGVKYTRIDKLITFIFFTLIFLIQFFCWRIFGLNITMQLYPIITHLPVVVFLVIYYKRPWAISISSVLTAYLCCQIPKWIGSMLSMITGSRIADHIGYFSAMCLVYYCLKKYVAGSVVQLMERSIRSCLLFGAVPLLYYLFDYITTIYTDLLYSGAREAVQFTPSLICTFYLFFVLLYYNEAQKQSRSERERDIIASQLHQVKLELSTMRQMQKNTMIYRHDMRHHLSLIGGYATDGNIVKIKEYLAITESDIDAMTPKCYCENETVNLILSNFEARSKKEGVVFHADVKLPEYIGLHDIELCSLLSNALENAIHAAARVEDQKLRKVFIQAVMRGDRLVLSTENAYVGEIEMEGELPTSKNKKDGHGFGIKSIIAIVERHGGLYSFETDGGLFILQLLIPLTKETTSKKLQ